MRIPKAFRRLVARVKPMIPAAAWPLLNTVASIPGERPLVADPASSPTLALFAHPDDETGCAGTLAKIGRQVTPVYATRGDGTRGSSLSPEETGRRRADEAAQACAALGLAAPQFLSYADGTLPAHGEELSREVEKLVAAHSPAQLFVPWFLDGHADHQAVSRAVAEADLPADLEVWAFEWWTALPPNRIVDVSATWSRKEAALACHVTAALAFDLTAGLGISRWRSLQGLHGHGHAEAFLVLPHARYRELVAQVGAAR